MLFVAHLEAKAWPKAQVWPNLRKLAKTWLFVAHLVNGSTMAENADAVSAHHHTQLRAQVPQPHPALLSTLPACVAVDRVLTDAD